MRKMINRLENTIPNQSIEYFVDPGPVSITLSEGFVGE
jgi:hypothetical protein